MLKYQDILSHIKHLSIAHNREWSSTINTNKQRSIKNAVIKCILPFYKEKDVNKWSPHIRAIFSPFGDDVEKVGSILFSDKKNVSLIHCLLYCVEPTYKIKTDGHDTIIKNTISILVSYVESGKLFGTHNYAKIGWTRQLLKRRINNCVNDKISLRYISDVFGVNICVCDMHKDMVFMCYGDPLFCKYKPTMFLSYHNNIYEVITYKGKVLLPYDSLIMQKLLSVDIASIHVISGMVNIIKKDDKVFKIGMQSLERYLPEPEYDKKALVVPCMSIKRIRLEANKLDIPIYNGTTKDGRVKPVPKKVLIILINEAIKEKGLPTSTT